MISREDKLMLACQTGNIPEVKDLLENQDVDVNFVKNTSLAGLYQTTPLINTIRLCEVNRTEILKLLLTHERIDINIMVQSGDYIPTLTALSEACCNGDLKSLRLLLIDGRTDKTTIFERMNWVFRQITLPDIYPIYLSERQKKLIMLFADQADKGMQFIKMNFIKMMDEGKMFGIHDSCYFKNWSDLHPNQHEALIIVIAYMMYLANKTDFSFDSIKNTIFEMGCNKFHTGDVEVDESQIRDTLNQTLCNQTYLAPLADSQLLKDKIEVIRQEVETLKRLKSFPSRSNAFNFLNGFFPYLEEEKRINTHNFSSQFNCLPLDIKRNIAGFLFNVPKQEMHTIEKDRIENDAIAFNQLTN